MLRWLRFLFYSAVLWFSLVSHGPAIRLSLRMLLSPRYYASSVACISCALLVLAASMVYAVWLGGATIAGWRLPLLANAIPLGLLAVTFLRGPLAPAPDPSDGLGPADRAREAMALFSQQLAASKKDPCSVPASEQTARLRSSKGLPSSGFWTFGRRVVFSVETHPGRNGPLQEVGASEPGTLLLACSPGGETYWITAVIADAVPVGRPALLRDGVGKVLLYRGQLETTQ